VVFQSHEISSPVQLSRFRFQSFLSATFTCRYVWKIALNRISSVLVCLMPSTAGFDLWYLFFSFCVSAAWKMRAKVCINYEFLMFLVDSWLWKWIEHVCEEFTCSYTEHTHYLCRLYSIEDNISCMKSFSCLVFVAQLQEFFMYRAHGIYKLMIRIWLHYFFILIVCVCMWIAIMESYVLRIVRYRSEHAVWLRWDRKLSYFRYSIGRVIQEFYLPHFTSLLVKG
jgi:hypothetical protein